MSKPTTITFKADEALADVLSALPNRSEFIRAAVLHALEHACPLCGGTGILTVTQRQHWEHFAASHHLTRCASCEEPHLVCGCGGCEEEHG